jgi:predicted membrane metal-binding protein
MSERRDIPEPGELIYAPRPSWVPALLAFALALAVCGIYAEAFLVRGWVYSVIGVVVALFALRLLTRESVREFFGLRRKQRIRGAVLPVEKIQPPTR